MRQNWNKRKPLYCIHNKQTELWNIIMSASYIYSWIKTLCVCVCVCVHIHMCVCFLCTVHTSDIYISNKINYTYLCFTMTKEIQYWTISVIAINLIKVLYCNQIWAGPGLIQEHKQSISRHWNIQIQSSTSAYTTNKLIHAISTQDGEIFHYILNFIWHKSSMIT